MEANSLGGQVRGWGTGRVGMGAFAVWLSSRLSAAWLSLSPGLSHLENGLMPLSSAASLLSGVDSSLTPCSGDSEPPGSALLSACAVPFPGDQNAASEPANLLTGAADSGKVSRAKDMGAYGWASSLESRVEGWKGLCSGWSRAQGVPGFPSVPHEAQ